MNFVYNTNNVQNPSLQAKTKLDIPTPQISTVQSYEQDLPANYEILTSYVRYRKPSSEEEEHQIEYNLDAEDESWLRSFHTKHTIKELSTNIPVPGSPRAQSVPRSPGLSSLGITNSIYPNLTPNTLEIMIDSLEKKTKFDAIPSTSEAHALFMEKVQIVFYTKLPSTSSTNSSSLSIMTHKKARLISEQVYQYWVNKRCKLKKPLLRKYWPVTASNDTNPHLVFRPREKEKYKLRKKRQNDIDAYRKMQQLKRDYEMIRVLLKLVKDRESLVQLKLAIQNEMFEQRLYDCVDTSGYPRVSKLSETDVASKLIIPRVPPWIENFQSRNDSSNKKKKRKRSSISQNNAINMSQYVGALDGNNSMMKNSSNVGYYGDQMTSSLDQSKTQLSNDRNDPMLPPLTNDHRNIPLFTHPLASRQKFVTNWDNAVPFVPSHINGVPAPTYKFKHRKRIGRGGRIIIDRLPYGTGKDENGKDLEHKVLMVGKGLNSSQKESSEKRGENKKSIYYSSSRGLLGLLPPKYLDYDSVSHKIKEIVAGYLSDDDNNKEEGGEEILVKNSDWVGMDDGPWGEERFAFGPI